VNANPENGCDPLLEEILFDHESLLHVRQTDIASRDEIASDPIPSRSDLLSLNPDRVNPENTSDEMSLLARIAQRDHHALAELYDRFAKVLFSVTIRIVRDETRAQEVLQEVFVQIWDRAADYNPRLGKPLTWAVILARNKAIDQLRCMQREGRLMDTLKDFADPTALPAEPVQQVAAQELAETMKTALRELPVEQRCAIELAFFRGLTQSEIADELRQPIGTIKARIRRGMLQLRSSLENHWKVCQP
jgi:RNA polymerase sigma-70 factor (ECF subfamily)